MRFINSDLYFLSPNRHQNQRILPDTYHDSKRIAAEKIERIGYLPDTILPVIAFHVHPLLAYNMRASIQFSGPQVGSVIHWLYLRS